MAPRGLRLLLCVLIAAAHGLSPVLGWSMCSVVDHGAVGDGRTSDSAAFRAAVANCSGGGVVVVPPGGRYLTAPFNLTSNIVLDVQAGAVILGTNYTRLRLPPLPTMGGSVAAGGGGGAGSPCRFAPLLGAYNATNVTIWGAGTIDGQGQQWWTYQLPPALTVCRKPMLLEFWYVHGLRLFDVRIHNSPFWNVHPYISQDIHIRGVSITADFPANAHYNTDGIDPDSCTDVMIEDYYYCAGDDAIAIKSGWNVAGVLASKPSQNITIRNSVAGCRGGWTIGSEAAGGVKDIVFENLVSTAESGIRISAELGRGGFVHNVSFRNLTFSWDHLLKKTFLFEVTQDYPNGGTNPPCIGCPIPRLSTNQTTPDFAGISFKDITVTRAPQGLRMGTINCSVAACRGITIDSVRVLSAHSSPPQSLSCTNVFGEQRNVATAIGNCTKSTRT